MTQENQYKGARWVHCDFHLHSPGSYGFKFPSGLSPKNSQKIIDEYIKQLKIQGIEIAALTDYQQIRNEWYIPLRDAAQQEGIYIYPGVELSFGGETSGKHGLHILAIFPYDIDPADINRAIDKLLDDDSSEPLISNKGEHRDLKPKGALSDSLLNFRQKHDCIFIFAHPNDSNGLFRSYRPPEAAELLAKILPEAIESFYKDDRQRLESTSNIQRVLLQRIANIENSDNHRIDEIGTKNNSGTPRRTYLKLSVLDDFRAIRMALRDNELLVKVGNKPTAEYTQITHLFIEGNGFLGGAEVNFSPDLNVLIGGRGVGKSAILEMIRYALDLRFYSDDKYSEGLIKHALGESGRVVIKIIKKIGTGVERHYQIQRTCGESPLVLENEKVINLPPRNLLSGESIPLFFGQKEMYSITQNSNFRQNLLDDLIGSEMQQLKQKIEEVKKELERNAHDIQDNEKEIQNREETEKRIREIDHEIQLYKNYGIVEKLERETELTKDEQRLVQTINSTRGIKEQLLDLQKQLDDSWQRLNNNLEHAISDLKDILREAQQEIANLQKNINALLNQVDQKITDSLSNLQKLLDRWKQLKRPLENELEETRQKIQKELGYSSLTPDKLITLTKEKQDLTFNLEHMKEIEKKIINLKEQRQQLLTNLQEIRRKIFELRKKKAAEISKDLDNRVIVNVEFGGQRGEFAELLAKFFNRSGLEKENYNLLAKNVWSGSDLAVLIREGEETLKEKIGLSIARTRQLINFINQDESRLFDLELLFPEDNVEVELKVNNLFLTLEKLSAGQRATAMLLILLSQINRILVIDQPEDDLDNRFVFEDVVQVLRTQKGHRQLIVATHNPNIPVLGHAEMVIGLEAQDNRAIIPIQGGIDQSKVQDIVRKVMEGGEEAFRRRAEKYGMEIHQGNG